MSFSKRISLQLQRDPSIRSRERPASEYKKRCSCDLPSSRLNTAISTHDHFTAPPPDYEEVDTSILSENSSLTTTPTNQDTFRYSFYSEMSSTPVSQTPSVQKPWLYNHKSNFRSYWTRKLPQDVNHDQVWYEYGVSSGLLNLDLVEAPECFFTCKMQVKKKSDRESVDRVCRFIAQALHMHRAEHGCLWPGCCRCTFETLRECEQARESLIRGRGLYKKCTKGGVGFAMALHDRWCSCGCFEKK